MLNDQTVKLKHEQALGEEYGRILEVYIAPFIDEKRRVLFEAFQDTSVLDIDALKSIKLQLTAINALEAHFVEYVTTGKLAKQQLES